MLDRLHNYIVAVVAAAVALVALLGVTLSLTLLKPANQVAATVTSAHELTMTRDGVLPLFDKEVVVTVSAGPTDTVALVQGSTADVKGWIGTAGYTEIIGVESDYERLAIVDHAGGPVMVDSPQSADSSQSADAAQSAQSAAAPQSGAAQAPQSAANAAQSGADAAQSGDSPQSGNTVAHKVADNDMWTTRVTGVGEAQMRLSDVQGSTSVLAVSSGQKPTLTLTWAVQQRNLLYGISAVIAGIFAALAIFAFARQYRLERLREERAVALEHRRSADTTDTDSWPASDLDAYAKEHEQREDAQASSSEEDHGLIAHAQTRHPDAALEDDSLPAYDETNSVGSFHGEVDSAAMDVLADAEQAHVEERDEDAHTEAASFAPDREPLGEAHPQNETADSETAPVRRTAWGRKTLKLAGVVSVDEETAGEETLSHDDSAHDTYGSEAGHAELSHAEISYPEADRTEAVLAEVEEKVTAGHEAEILGSSADEESSDPSLPVEVQPAAEQTEAFLGRHAGAATSGRDDHESVTTDTGTIDLSGIRPGAILPSRRALREARERGESALIIEGHSFDTGLIPQIAKVDARDIENMTEGSSSQGSAKVEEYIVDVAPEGASRTKNSESASDSGWTSMMTSWVRGRKSEEENR